jgi:hypothetical protein
LIFNALKSRENARIKKFIIKNLESPRFFGYSHHSKNYIFSTLALSKKLSPTNYFRMFQSEVLDIIIFGNSPNFELDPVKKKSKFFRKGYFKKVLDPPYPDP